MSVKPSALINFESILKQAEGKELLFFLDYDGTLTPIVGHPKDALLSEDMRLVLEKLGKSFFTAVVTGRGLKDVKELVPIKHLYFAGSHGFQLENPEGEVFTYPEALPYKKEITKAYEYLSENLSNISGIVLENKEFSIAVHYRLVREGLDKVQETVNNAKYLFKGLKVTAGKQVFEFKPDIPWDKGKGVLWFIENAKTMKPPFPIFIGDDTTDEDAFLAIKGLGTSIFVEGEKRESNADYSLKDPNEVLLFLKMFLIRKNVMKEI